ncbi:isoprenyl transferase [Nisaea acidiphila]|uniref:Isoprenyl transferase n=1 Tax=Nisaea acidiphila TaxID=1862145 RepID=A0A9J7AU67_9PROT|nr:isoprenyl transferase [Nisaea acidiphila]UUX50370.1 isoprenyl transferase [Nisaea acidiphila]
MAESDAEQQPNTPRHVAIIMDGNGRWARARGLPRTIGHQRGAEAVRRTVEASLELGIGYLTLFGFSSENWKRPKTEVLDLMGLLRRYLKSEIAELHEKGVRFRVIGDRGRLDRDIVNLIEQAERLTGGNRDLVLTIALSYGGRDEIAGTARKLAQLVADGALQPEQISEQVFAEQLETADIPDPELLIRTSGEKRISNFMLWQCAYSEYVFMQTLWPDFGKDQMIEAIDEFCQRDRRFGAAVG